MLRIDDIPQQVADDMQGFALIYSHQRYTIEKNNKFMSEANNKVPGHPLKIFDFVSGSGSYIIFAEQIYHTALPYIISRQRYIIHTECDPLIYFRLNVMKIDSLLNGYPEKIKVADTTMLHYVQTMGEGFPFL